MKERSVNYDFSNHYVRVFSLHKIKKNIQFVHTTGMRLSLISHHELKFFIHTGLMAFANSTVHNALQRASIKRCLRQGRQSVVKIGGPKLGGSLEWAPFSKLLGGGLPPPYDRRPWTLRSATSCTGDSYTFDSSSRLIGFD